jgi:hypothetical protein
MNPLTAANALANVIVAGAVAGMAIKVFGDPKHNIHQHPQLFWIRKLISTVVICGAVLNLITLSTPGWTEVILNLGFAGNYLFSLYYHDRTTRPKHSSSPTAVPKRNTPRRPSGAGKNGKSSAPSLYRGKRTSTR